MCSEGDLDLHLDLERDLDHQFDLIWKALGVDPTKTIQLSVTTSLAKGLTVIIVLSILLNMKIGQCLLPTRYLRVFTSTRTT